jgi:hypothetical protein
MILGTFTSEFNLPEDVEITKSVDKKFIDNVYIFMMSHSKILDLKPYFQEKEYYRKRGNMFDEDIIEVFIESHVAWIKR